MTVMPLMLDLVSIAMKSLTLTVVSLAFLLCGCIDRHEPKAFRDPVIAIDYDAAVTVADQVVSVEDFIKRSDIEAGKILYLTLLDKRGVSKSREAEMNRLNGWIVERRLAIWIRSVTSEMLIEETPYTEWDGSVTSLIIGR